MAKKVTRSEVVEAIALRVTSAFMHHGVCVRVGEVIQCTREEAEACLYHGWAQLHPVNGRHQRRDMRAES